MQVHCGGASCYDDALFALFTISMLVRNTLWNVDVQAEVYVLSCMSVHLGKEFGLKTIISDDYVAVEKAIVELQPELILGTQMERHIAKKHNIPSAVISAPMHVQDFPCRYSPQMGFEGSNVLFDTWIHPLVMGLEEHLLTMFRDDVEFNENVVPSHLASEGQSTVSVSEIDLTNSEVFWEQDAEKELKKIPFFVRGKARRNTEKFAVEHGFTRISLDTLYDAKAHYAR